MTLMNTRFLKYTFLVLALLCVSLSCKVIKPYERPQLNTIDLYRGQTATDTATIAAMPWESLFADTILKSLIREGLNNNLNLKIAVQKIAEAQAALGQTKAAFLPNVSANASTTRSKLSAASLDYPPGTVINTVTTAYQLGISSSWEAQKRRPTQIYCKPMLPNGRCKPN
jgi:outer membrane protein TolC